MINSVIVGIIESKKVPKKKNNISPPEKFWKPLVAIWENIYGELVPKVDDGYGNLETAKPSFIGIEMQHMKSLIKELRERAEKKNIEWTLEVAKKRWEAFLRKAWEDKFVSENFMIRIISNNRTKIFNNQITPKNGTHQQSSSKSSNRNSKTAGAELLLTSLKKDILSGRE